MPGLKTCPSCQNKISERAATCPKCGNELQGQCMVCKEFIMKDGIRCPECGDPNPFDERPVSNKGAKKHGTKITAITIPGKENEEGHERYIKTPKAVRSKTDPGSKQWSIYTKGGRIEAVKHGFCWPAFFFTFGWAVFRKLWLVAISYFVFINFMEFKIYDTFVPADSAFAPFPAGAYKMYVFYACLIALELLFRFAFGYSGNRLAAARLEKKGFWKGITLNAKNKQSAIEKYIR